MPLYISVLFMNGASEDLFATTIMSDSAAMEIYMCQFIDYFKKLATCVSIHWFDWSQGYKTFFMLNSAEHEICPAKKLQNTDICSFFLAKHSWAWKKFYNPGAWFLRSEAAKTYCLCLKHFFFTNKYLKLIKLQVMFIRSDRLESTLQ